MARALVFDPTAGQAFVEQWQRYDYGLLQNGYVHRFDPADDLSRATGELTRLGYLVHQVDASGWRNAGDLHDGLAGALSFPDYYGRNLDALNDVLGDVAMYEYGSDPDATGTVLAVRGFEQVVGFDARLAHDVLDIFAQAAQHAALLGHPMLCLVTAPADLAPVGARAVSRAWPPASPPLG